jgi:hypothetical protein
MNRQTTLSVLATATTLGLPRIARGADVTPLQLGTMGADGSAEPFYGADHNFFKDAGFDVTITVMNNTAQLASAVAGGALGIANHADTQPIILKYTKITPEVAGKMLRSTYGEQKADVALLQPVLDLAVKYGGMQPVAAGELIWEG